MQILARDKFVFIIGDRTEKINGEDQHPYFMVPLYQYNVKKGYMSDYMIKHLKLSKASQGDSIFAAVAAGRVALGLDYPDGLPESEYKLSAALD